MENKYDMLKPALDRLGDQFSLGDQLNLHKPISGKVEELNLCSISPEQALFRQVRRPIVQA